MPKKPPNYMDDKKNTVPRKFLKNTLGMRKKKIKGLKEDYCKGFIDAHGQWNNGFYCPRWSSDPNQVFCCGTKHDRYCCKPPGQEPITGFSTESLPHENTPSSPSTPSSKAATNSSSVAPQCYLDCHITTIAALTISISVLLTLVMLVLCWVWPRYMMYRKNKKTVQKITDGLGVPRTLIANTSGMTLVYQLQPMTSSLVGPSDLHQPMLLDRSNRVAETSLYAVSDPPPYQMEESMVYKDKKLKVGLKKKRMSSEVLTNFNIVPNFYGQDQTYQFARVSNLSQTPLMLPPHQGDYHEYMETPEKVAL